MKKNIETLIWLGGVSALCFTLLETRVAPLQVFYGFLARAVIAMILYALAWGITTVVIAFFYSTFSIEKAIEKSRVVLVPAFLIGLLPVIYTISVFGRFATYADTFAVSTCFFVLVGMVTVIALLFRGRPSLAWADSLLGFKVGKFPSTKTPTKTRIPPNGEVIGIGLILILGYCLRQNLLLRGLPYSHNWEESGTLNSAIQMFRTGDLNPHFFNDPSVAFYLQYMWLHLSYPIAKLSHLVQSRNEIVTQMDTGYQWTISHTYFYFMGRALIALLSTASIWVMYRTGLLLRNGFVGLVAAGIIAFNGYYVNNSAWATVDLVTAGAVMLWIYSVVWFSKFPSRSRLDLVGILAGIAVSCKYNVVLIFVPTLWLAYRSSPIKDWPYHLMRTLVVGVVFFFLASPFALLDPANFFLGMSREFVHYAFHGYEGHEARGRIANFWSDFKFLSTRFPLGFVVFGGIVWQARRLFQKKNENCLAILALFPVLYFLFMGLMKPTFYRNLLPHFPFMALFGACLLDDIIRKYLVILKRVPSEWVAAALFLIPSALAIHATWYYKPLTDSRSSIVTEVREKLIPKLGPDETIAVAEELRLHNEDAVKLGKYLITIPMKDLSPKNFGRFKIKYVMLPEWPKGFDPQAQDMGKAIVLKYPRIITRGVAEIAAQMPPANPRVTVLEVDRSNYR